jgi:hypothetical protein
MAGNDLLSRIKQTVLLTELPNRTAGTATAATFVSASGFENHTIIFNLGTANDAGSVTAFRVLQGTAASPGGSTVLVAGGTLTSFTNGGSAYAVEIKTNQLTAGYDYIGAEVVVASAGSATFGVRLLQYNARNQPTSSGFGGTVQVLA